jgi:hypothetical protein
MQTTRPAIPADYLRVLQLVALSSGRIRQTDLGALYCLEYLRDYGATPAVRLALKGWGGSLVSLEQAGLVESDTVGSDALVSITDAGRAALGVQP